MILALLGTAWANCDSINELNSSGAPLSVVVAQAAKEGPSAHLADCLASLQMPDAVVTAARTGAVPPPPATSLPPHLAPTPISPTGALGLSVAIGLGSGHFYARRPALGVLFLASQIAGVGLVTHGANESKAGAMRSGAILFGASRLAEVASVGFVADQAQAR